jgi:hypothetical protein
MRRYNRNRSSARRNRVGIQGIAFVTAYCIGAFIAAAASERSCRALINIDALVVAISGKPWLAHACLITGTALGSCGAALWNHRISQQALAGASRHYKVLRARLVTAEIGAQIDAISSRA